MEIKPRPFIPIPGGPCVPPPGRPWPIREYEAVMDQISAASAGATATLEKAEEIETKIDAVEDALKEAELKITEIDTRKEVALESIASAETGVLEDISEAKTHAVADVEASTYDAKAAALQSEEAAEKASTYLEIYETYAKVIVPVFTVDFSDGELKYQDSCSYDFTVNTESGQLEYELKEA